MQFEESMSCVSSPEIGILNFSGGFDGQRVGDGIPGDDEFSNIESFVRKTGGSLIIGKVLMQGDTSSQHQKTCKKDRNAFISRGTSCVPHAKFQKTTPALIGKFLTLASSVMSTNVSKFK